MGDAKRITNGFNRETLEICPGPAGLQFDLIDAAKESAKIVEAQCSAKILPSRGEGELPRVYDLVPRDYYDESKDPAQLKIDPSLGVGFLKLSGLSLTTKLDIGSQQPVVVGYPGEDERAPYWDLRPRKRPLQGWHRFWLILECQASSKSFDIAVKAGAVAMTKIGPLTIGPKNWQWTDRPRVSILVGESRALDAELFLTAREDPAQEI